jgi:hypothetical protein
MNGNYRHTQRAPLCLLVYGTAIMFFVLGWLLRNEPVIQWVFPSVGLLMLVLAGSFHHLTVEDEGNQLSISFGPLPLFRRSVKYENIVSVGVGRTTILDGWGIHMSFRGGWVWNIWGRDCVVLRLRKGTGWLGHTLGCRQRNRLLPVDAQLVQVSCLRTLGWTAPNLAKVGLFRRAVTGRRKRSFSTARFDKTNPKCTLVVQSF